MEVFLAYLFKMGHALHSQSPWSQAQFFKARAPARRALLGLWARCSQGQGDPPFPSHVQKVPFFIALTDMVITTPLGCYQIPISMRCLLMRHATFKPNPNLTSLASVRNSVPYYLLYLSYWSFATQAMEMKLLTVDVLCQCEVFQFPGKRCCTGKTTSLGTAISWFYLHKSAKLTCFPWQNFLPGRWRDRGVLHWDRIFGTRTAVAVKLVISLCFSLLHYPILPPDEIDCTDPFYCT